MIGLNQTLIRRLLAWYRRERRDLPWRVAADAAPGARPDPYSVLVSEAMLQQTQVATVIPYFQRFIERFPTIESLAAADEQEVLRQWQGLGYYSRARNLLAAARVVVRDFHGQVPDEVAHLRRLPGVGRYTAGAIASLAFNRREALVDGNVARVLCRLDRIQSDPRQKKTSELIWRRASELVPQTGAGDFNSALMELGAIICTPKSPRCRQCPIQSHCRAQADGAQERIPRPRPALPVPLLRRRTLCIRNATARGELWLLEQRPSSGRWAGMWQFFTRPVGSRDRLFDTTRPRKLATLTHRLTHRRYQFNVYVCGLRAGKSYENPPRCTGGTARWVCLSDLGRFPLSRPHLKIAQMLHERSRWQRLFAPTSPISYIPSGTGRSDINR